MIICAGGNEQFSFARSVGIGLIDSAITLTKIMLLEQPKYLLFVGSAGSYGRLPLLEVFESTKASNIELSLLQAQSYTPLDNMLCDENVSHETKTVNSSNYITTDSKLSEQFIALDIDLENMEFYSVLKVAQHFGIQAKAILVTTNYCHKSAQNEFSLNHRQALKRLESYTRECYAEYF